MQFFNSIGPKTGTSVTPPSIKSTEHGLMGAFGSFDAKTVNLFFDEDLETDSF